MSKSFCWLCERASTDPESLGRDWHWPAVSWAPCTLCRRTMEVCHFSSVLCLLGKNSFDEPSGSTVQYVHLCAGLKGGVLAGAVGLCKFWVLSACWKLCKVELWEFESARCPRCQANATFKYMSPSCCGFWPSCLKGIGAEVLVWETALSWSCVTHAAVGEGHVLDGIHFPEQ